MLQLPPASRRAGHRGDRASSAPRRGAGPRRPGRSWSCRYGASAYLNLAQAQGTGYSNYTIPSGASDTSCEGLGGYSDIRAGAQLVVKDEAGKVIGSGTLDQGHLDIDLLGAGAVCGFPFTITGLPKAEQYELGMGNRGSITYSFADLESAKWDVKLTLGP